MKRFSKINDVVYVLDFTGTLLQKTTMDGAIKYTGIPQSSIYESLRTNCLVQSKYIFSKTPETVLQARYTHNPLFGNIPPEIANEFIVEQRSWEKSVNEISYEDRRIETEKKRRWNSLVESLRKNRGKKKQAWEEFKQEREPKIVKPYVKETHSEKKESTLMSEDIREDVAEAMLKNDTTQKLLKIFEPFIKPLLIGFLKKLNNDETRTMQFFDKKSGLLVFLDMKTENIKEFEVAGVQKEDIFTIDPQEIHRGNVKGIIEQLINKYS